MSKKFMVVRIPEQRSKRGEVLLPLLRVKKMLPQFCSDLKLLLSKGKISQDLVNMLTSWRRSGFNVLRVKNSTVR